MNYQKYFKRHFLLRLFLLFFLLIIPNLLYFFILHEKRPVYLINNLLIITLSLLLLKIPFVKITGYLLILIFVLNNALEIFSLYFYKGSFNVGMAMNFLGSNAAEFTEMSSIYWYVFIIITAYYILICFVLNSLKKSLDSKILLSFAFLLILYPAYLIYIQSNLNRRNNLYKKANESDLYFYLGATPISTFAPFIEANHYIDIVKETSKDNFVYPSLKVTNNNIQNIVVVLGESARRDALNLYGNKLNTTPLIEKRISNLLIYKNAISPGEFTNLALSLILSKQVPDNNFSIEKNKDNIISLANATNVWKTYWVSNQEKTGMFVNLFANINLKARNKFWTEPDSYDEAILPFMDTILEDSIKKRVIFIHLMGSHPSAGKRYPKNFDIFKTEKKTFLNEYNNSILYTDFILDKIIKKLEESSSIVLYLSDHGQTIQDGAYRHSTSKKGFDVPFFIWYSNSVENSYKKTGEIDEYISISNLYNILKDFMGIQGIIPKNSNDSLKVMDGTLKPLLYMNLAPGK